MAAERTDIKQNTFIDKTNGISEEVLKKLNIAVKKEIAGYNSKLKELNSHLRKKDEDSYKKVEEELSKIKNSVKDSSLSQKIISDLSEEMGVDDIFSGIKNNTPGIQLGDVLVDGVSKNTDYTQILLVNLFELNDAKINAYKNISPFRRKSDEVIVDPVKNK